LGTLELLELQERERVKGLVINKFRGDKTLLDSGIDMLEERGKVPVIGTIPYAKLMIDDEDSLSERLGNDSQSPQAAVDIAVVRLPRISNFTDVAPFESIEGVNVRFVTNPRELSSADLVIIPGSKNTISDLIWMRESGMEAAVKRFAVSGPVVGICGGFQMLGELVEDPESIENEDVASIKDIGLLPIRTQLKNAKHRSQTEDCFDDLSGVFEVLSGEEFIGYEIHNGISSPTSQAMTSDLFEHDEEGQIILVQRENVLGTYVHGVFDNNDLALRLVRALAEAKGTKLETTMDYQAFKEAEYDKLAEIVRNNLDMDLVYSILK
jgi:adenosylcobyric acid synthase